MYKNKTGLKRYINIHVHEITGYKHVNSHHVDLMVPSVGFSFFVMEQQLVCEVVIETQQILYKRNNSNNKYLRKFTGYTSAIVTRAEEH